MGRAKTETAADRPYVNSLTVEERHSLVLQWRNYGYQLVRYFAGSIHRSEMLSAAHMALVVASVKWDPSNGASYQTYLRYWCIKYARQEYRQRMQRGEQLPRQCVLYEEESEEGLEFFEKLIEYAKNERDRAILKEKFIEGRSYVLIGKSLGISEARVQQLARRGLEDIKRAIVAGCVRGVAVESSVIGNRIVHKLVCDKTT